MLRKMVSGAPGDPFTASASTWGELMRAVLEQGVVEVVPGDRSPGQLRKMLALQIAREGGR
ncbi:hypothetical protein E4U56_003908 [Claviceps arundinis]|uniref:Uncharacterized protein n=1 Tax=Claviceps arundinis TaxID=1623583 RepID=A0A9P7MP84_9HYPO|nr:hypothetical protein E4U56_003908 [Claviceps arundinis]